MKISLYSFNVKAACRRATVDRSYINIHMYTIRIILFVDDALVASILSHYTYTHILKPIDMLCPGLSYVYTVFSHSAVKCAIDFHYFFFFWFRL